jgi:putative ABC transport system permease protein
MFDLDKWQEIFSTIQKNKLRTLATAFSVFWGILMLVLLLGAGQGLQNGVERSMLLDATNSIWFFTWRTSLPFKGMPAGRSLQFTEEDLISIEENIDGIDIISPENMLYGDFNVKRGNKNAPFGIFGAEEDYFDIKVTQKYIAGRKLNRIDDIQARKICVIGDRVAEVLFEPDEDPIGKYINIKDVFFKIAGIYRFEGYSISQSERIYMPFSTFQRTFNTKRSVTLFAVTTEEGVIGKDLEKRIIKLLAQRHLVHPDDNQAFWTHNQEDQHRSVLNLFLGIKSFVWFVGLGTLIAGIVGISNIMIIVVKERTREIGIRKALGATPWSIVSLILQESIMITAVAGYAGLVVGVGFLEALNYFMEMTGANIEYFNRPEIDFTTVISATLVLIIAGAVAGFFPALQASMVRPVEALRNE